MPAVGLSKDRAAALALGSEAKKLLASRREGGMHRQVTVGGAAQHWRDDRDEVRVAAEPCGRQERLVGEEQHFLTGAEFLLISGIVLSFIFTAGCSLLPAWRMRTAFTERSSLPASL